LDAGEISVQDGVSWSSVVVVAADDPVEKPPPHSQVKWLM